MAFLLIWAFTSQEAYEIEQIEIVVKPGDTLWEIAEENCPNQDPRKTIFEIKKLNNLEGHIQPHQSLTVPKQVSRGRVIKVEATAYTHTGNRTATGTWPEEGRTIAVDPDVIPLGSQVVIEGKEYIAEDTGGVVKGNIIDIFMDSETECWNWGRQEIDILVIE